MTFAVEAEGLSFGWGRHPLVADMSMSLSLEAHGGRLPIVGRSGSGKTTMMYVLAGLKLPQQGRVRWRFPDGEEISWSTQAGGPGFDQAAQQQRARRFGFCFQDSTLLPHLTIEQNLAYPVEILAHRGALRAGNVESRVHDALGRVLTARESIRAIAGKYPEQVSGGQRQRVALAQAMITAPTVLFADEPTGSLDPDTRGEIMSLIDAWLDDSSSAMPRAFVWVTHHRDEREFRGVHTYLEIVSSETGAVVRATSSGQRRVSVLVGTDDAAHQSAVA